MVATGGASSALPAPGASSKPLLTKKGTPLGNAWIAAHMEKRLQKGQIVKTAIDGTVAEVIENNDGTLALRISGHLLLGIVRIHSRQVDYLMQDAADAVVKVRLAFKQPNVDMPAEAATRRAEEITNPRATPQAGALDVELDFGAAPFDTLDLPSLGVLATDPDAPGEEGGDRRASGGIAHGANLALETDITLAAHDEARGGHGAHAHDHGPQLGEFDFPADAEAYRDFENPVQPDPRGGEEGHEEEEEERLRRDSSGGGLGLAGLGGRLSGLEGADDPTMMDLPAYDASGGEAGLGLGDLDLPHEPEMAGVVDHDDPLLHHDAPGGLEPPLDAAGAGADEVEGRELHADYVGDAAGHEALDDVMAAGAGIPTTPGLMGAALDGRTPSVAVDSAAPAAGRQAARRRPRAARFVLLVDVDTQLTTEEMRKNLADASATVALAAATPAGKRRSTRDDDAVRAAEEAVAAHARQVGSADIADLLAAPVVHGEPEDMCWAYASRPYLGATTDRPTKRRRSSVATAAAAAEGEEAGVSLNDGDQALADEAQGEAHLPGDQGGEGVAPADEDLAAAADEYAAGDDGPVHQGEEDQLPPHVEEDVNGYDMNDGAVAPYQDHDQDYAPDRETPEAYGVDLPVVDGAEDVAQPSTQDGEGGRVGWSTRTRMMFGLLARTFDAQAERHSHVGDADAPPVLSYKALAAHTKARGGRRRVVAGCFQELLFLTSHGLVTLDQKDAYGDVWIAKTDKFDRTSIAEGLSQAS